MKDADIEVNDGLFVRRAVCTATAPCGAYICQPCPLWRQLCSAEETCQPTATCAGAGRTLARSQGFEMLAAASAQRHCVSLWIFFLSFSSIGRVPSATKCVTALQHLSEPPPHFTAGIHLFSFESNTWKTGPANTETMAFHSV